MTSPLTSLPSPGAPTGTTWTQWVLSNVDDGWRSVEWDPEALLFTGDVGNALTQAYACSSSDCSLVTHVQNGRCSSCRNIASRADRGAAARRPGGSRSGYIPGSGGLAIHQFSLAGHSPLLRAELLHALQRRDAAQIVLSPWTIRAVLKCLPAESDSLLDLRRDALTDWTASARGLLRGLLSPLERLHLAFTGADATAGDVWDCALVGLNSARNRRYPAVSGHLDFRPIRLEWLRELVKSWARDLRPPVTDVSATIYAAQLAARALAAQPHRGEPARLRLADMGVVIDALMSSTRADGTPHSDSHRRAHIGWWRRLLDYCRPAGLMTNVPDGFTMSGHYRRLSATRTTTSEEEPGEAIPEHVLAQMDEHLALIGAHTSFTNGGWAAADFATMYRTAYQIQRDTGRRNNEITSLAADCLRWDGDQPVLVWDNHKAKRLGRRLPIHRDTADIIDTWQQHRAELPLPQESSKFLFPGPGSRNRPRNGHLSELTYAKMFRAWLDAMPPLSDIGLDEHGVPRLYDKSRVRPYGLRHAYAQRHADGGTSVDVLRELMDHRSVETTIGYYQVSQKRKQEAVRLLAPRAVDRHGHPAGFTDELVYEMASVAVPFGNCTEPSNVKAGGQHCPIRFQCAGCGFYRPDPSFLPAIEEHVVELAADREIATATAAAGWVVSNIADQITAFTTVRDRLRDDLATMPAATREAVESAGRELRKARAAAFIPLEQVRSRHR